MNTALSHLLVCPLVMGMLSAGDLMAVDISVKPEKAMRFDLKGSFKFYHELGLLKKLIEPCRSPSEKLRVIHIDRFYGTSVLSLHEYEDDGQTLYEVTRLAVYNFHPEQSAINPQAEIVEKTASLSLQDGAHLLNLCDSAAEKSKMITRADFAEISNIYHLEMKGDDANRSGYHLSFIALNENDPLWIIQQVVQVLGNYVTYGEKFGSLAEFRKFSSD